MTTRLNHGISEGRFRKIDQITETDLRTMAAAIGCSNADFNLEPNGGVRPTITKQDLMRYEKICPELAAFTRRMIIALHDIGNAGWQVADNADTSEPDAYQFGSMNDWEMLNEALNEHMGIIQAATDLISDD